MKIALFSSEVVPFAKTGGLADVCGALPLALEKLGHQVIVVMPGYGFIQRSGKYKTYRLKGKLSYSVIGKNVRVYFVENDSFFNREGLYGDKAGDYTDNLDRFSYFCRHGLLMLKDIDFCPDAIHCHDWQSGLVPVYLKSLYRDDPFFGKTCSMLTVHNIGYQGYFAREYFPRLGLDWSYFNMDMLEFHGGVNLLKGGIVFADSITTVSPTYSKEIQTPEYGFGLDGVLQKRKNSLFGILNGLDYSIWDPSCDGFIARTYGPGNVKDKAANKAALQKECGFPVKRSVPLVGIVSRLAQQKGFDIIAEATERILAMNIQLAVLGTGDLKYQQLLQDLAAKYPRQVFLNQKFDDPFAHKIYAGSDVFLMPSLYEPCGLGQMIALKYATLPLVYKTGGLADTVNDKNGFVFDKYDKESLIKLLEKAIKTFKDAGRWGQMMQEAMACNFSWDQSARRYVQLYEKSKRK